MAGVLGFGVGSRAVLESGVEALRIIEERDGDIKELSLHFLGVKIATYYNPKGPRTQIKNSPNTSKISVFGHQSPMIWVLGPLG